MEMSSEGTDIIIDQRILRKGSLRDLIRSVSKIDSMTDISQSVYVIEECAELIKELTKKCRGKEDQTKIFDEACDVLTTVFVLLYQNGAKEDEVKNRIMYKCKRTLYRYMKNGEA